jgi:hypothetical protein
MNYTTILSEKSTRHVQLLGYYVLFGALHELSHLFAASLAFGVPEYTAVDWIRIVFMRQSVFVLNQDPPYESYTQEQQLLWIRHAGWIASVLFATCVWVFRSEQQGSHQNLALQAATLTAIEALSTDLFGFATIPFFPTTIVSKGTTTFFCGNFGIILLHQAWWTDTHQAALDVLQTMIQVTMMRGAQSGGVVVFVKNAFQRVRVVNYKRTSLDQLLRAKIHARVHWSLLKQNQAVVVSGHTRFATTSKATLEGTHPQQWTPRRSERVWNFVTNKLERVDVENYVTHNGDFEFYSFGGTTYELGAVQAFLSVVTGLPTPAVVDSCAVAGMLDVLRTKGCFGRSARYAVCFALRTSRLEADVDTFPTPTQLDTIARVFEECFAQLVNELADPKDLQEPATRLRLARLVAPKLAVQKNELLRPNMLLGRYITSTDLTDAIEDAPAAGGSSLLSFCIATIDAFLDNDLFFTMKTFLANAKGSFGLCFQSSLDAHRQICLAARGQTMSVAFYPSKGLICYGSEQAAVKAGILAQIPTSSSSSDDALGTSRGEIDDDALRLDLDDLGGEAVLLDWGKSSEGLTTNTDPIVSKPNQGLRAYELMNGAVTVVIFQESRAADRDREIYHRLTRLTRNPNIKPLRPEADDEILNDIQDIPKICQAIQNEWHSDKACTSLNRLTAFHLSRCLRDRLEAHINGRVPINGIDILLTGCEVSLWVAEQFASDLKKSFPRLRVQAVSSNKLLGLYGQEIAIPTSGFQYSSKTQDLNDSIVIIVSHSGGTFAPLSCSSLLQSKTRNLFAITSELDTQVGKQLRALDAIYEEGNDHPFLSRIFSTEVGMRPAEPCSVSVAATHQLLTNLFEYVSALILSDNRYRRVTGAVISEQDLQILETCNRYCIDALSDIVGVDRAGSEITRKDRTETNLRAAGDLWAEHILENARACMMSFVYIFVTVTIGYPLLYGIAVACGLNRESKFVYLSKSHCRSM